MPLASHLILKGLVKSGKDNKDAELSLSFNKLKASFRSFPHLKPTFFLMHSIKGTAMVEKILNEPSIKAS